MSEWDSGSHSGYGGGNDNETNGGRSFGKGRGFVPRDGPPRGNDTNGGRGGRGGGFRGSRRGSGGGRFNNDSDRGGFGGSRRGGFGNDQENSSDGGWNAEPNSNSNWGGANNATDNDSSSGWGARSENRGGPSNDSSSGWGDRSENRGGPSGWSNDDGGRTRKPRDNNNNNDGGGFGGNENGEGDDGRPKVPFYAPKEATEDELIAGCGGISTGINFDDYDKISVKVTGSNVPKELQSFDQAHFRDLLMKNIRRFNYDKPTPIQKYAIPAVSDGRDIMATAQTGSGKTAAYLLPIINSMMSQNYEGSDGNAGTPTAMILAPTRELCIQIFENARKFALGSYIRPCIAYGGASGGQQIGKIRSGCHIIIATTGRLKDFTRKGIISYRSLKFVVLDEADRMLDMGFSGDIDFLLKHESMSSEPRQTLMFSATFSQDVQRLAGNYLTDYIFIAVGIVGGACKDVEQNFIEVPYKEKKSKLMEILNNEPDNTGTLLFVEKKRTADFIASFLSEKGLETTSIHGDRFQEQREEALHDFKSKRKHILVATNVAARGLDISGVKHVINFDLPKDVDEYVHRIGRTGRLGNKGKATSFYDENESQDKELGSKLVRVLEQAGQRVPSFLSGGNNFGEDFDDAGFGGVDYRHNAGFKTDPNNHPQACQNTETWD